MFKIIKQVSTQNLSLQPFIPSFPLRNSSLHFPFGCFHCLYLSTIIFFLFSSWFGLQADVCPQQLQPGMTEMIRGSFQKARRAKRVRCKLHPKASSQVHVPIACPRDTGGIWKPTRSLMLHDDWWLLRNTSDVSWERVNCANLTAIYGGRWDICGSAMKRSCKQENAAAVSADLKSFNVSVNMGYYWPGSL